MNRSKLKSYAPKARRDFIRAVTDRAARFGITASQKEPAHEQGDAVVILGTPYPRSIGEQRRKLLRRIEINAFEQVMEEIAYTWFNRFAAIRFMEVNGYLDHGLRVLSHPAGKAIPEILEKAELAELPGLPKDKVLEMKLDGRSDAKLYRLLLVAQCNALHRAMPFLFERIDDETELLLPDNLLHSDSVIRQMVEATDEADWRQIEIIGWLYQFYIAEKKEQVIGKVVRSEDIPAATQLFTPNWIVKYMVQNSLGAKWLATYPDSALKAKMEYHIEPAEQTVEVQAKLAEITPKSLDPEAITLMDPACGSGHILIEAYNLFREIYLERGYQTRDIPRLILEKNLYGLEICDRAAQLAGFAVLMRARRDDARILESPPKLNVLAIQSSKGLDAKAIAREPLREERVDLVPPGDLLPETLAQPGLSVTTVTNRDIRELLALFEGAKTFGSLIQVPQALRDRLPLIEQSLARPRFADPLWRQAFEETKQTLGQLVAQSKLLGRRYDCLVVNPPYMGSKGMILPLKNFAQNCFPEGKADLMTCFMLRAIISTHRDGFWSMINIPSWMFLYSFEDFRKSILSEQTVISMLHLGRGIFGSDFGTVCFVFANRMANFGERGVYRRLFERHVQVRSIAEIKAAFLDREYGRFHFSQANFSNIPGRPIVYWISDALLKTFTSADSLGQQAKIREGINTGDNARFLRLWHEVSFKNTSIVHRKKAISEPKWFPHRKGGVFRKWYGNNTYILNWKDDGREIHVFHGLPINYNGAPVRGKAFFYLRALSWSRVSSGWFSIRLYSPGQTFDSTAPSIFCQQKDEGFMLSLLNGPIVRSLLAAISPTLDFRITNIGRLPIKKLCDHKQSTIESNARTLVELARKDWDAFEESWDFVVSPLLRTSGDRLCLSSSFDHQRICWQEMTNEMKSREINNNRLLIDAYGLTDELSPDVPLREITLTCNPHYRYGGDLTDAEREERLRADTMKELISYAVGCMMGRYSLDEPGLIYAHAGNEGFDPSRYQTFPADADGIVPVTDIEWFADDAANRFVEFIKVAWPAETLAENLAFVAESLGTKSGETAADTIRRYLSQSFFKDHLQTYKRRPIYWLFSSGKQKAFEALVYLHRYNEGTLARLRMAYVTPLMAMLRGRIDQLDEQAKAASSTAAARKLEKSRSRLLAKQSELVEFDEKLRHYADQRITLDLDDGVKVNYAKFGDLLAEVKAVTGQKEE